MVLLLLTWAPVLDHAHPSHLRLAHFHFLTEEALTLSAFAQQVVNPSLVQVQVMSETC